MKPGPEFYEVAGEFIKDFFGKSPRLSQQRYYKKKVNNLSQFTYYPIGNKITTSILVEHFYLTPIDKNYYFTGSISVAPLFDDGIRFVCIDLDDIEKIALFEKKFLPKLHEYGFPTMIEHGGDIVNDSFTRQHIWIPLRGEKDTVKLLFDQILDEIGSNYQEFDEIFGVNKINERLRLFLGPHLKRDGIKFPVEIDYEYVNDPVIVMKHYLSLPRMDERELQKRIKDSFREKNKSRNIVVNYTPRKQGFKYLNRDLELPFECPSIVETVAKNCQAVNKILFNIRDEGWIAKAGTIYHNTGLNVQRLGAYHDAKVSRRLSKETFEGREWFTDLVRKYRPRDPETHKWDSNQEQIMRNPDRYFMSCEKWDEKFDLCKGCPFKDLIESPSIFTKGKEIEANKIGEVQRGIETSDTRRSEENNS